MKYRAWWKLCATVIISAGIVFAQALPALCADSRDNYKVLKFGTFAPEGDIEAFDDGIVLEFGFGHYFNENAAIEVTFGAISMNYPAYPEEYDLDVFPFTVNLKGIAPIDGAEFYGMAGLGIYHVTVWVGYDITDTVPGGDLGIGLKLKFSDDFAMAFEFKYWITDTIADTDIAVEGKSFTIGFAF